MDDATVINGEAVLSTPQVYDYIATRKAQGSPVAQYLEEAELEPIDAERAHMLAFDVHVQSRDKDFVTAYLGFRCVKDP